MEPERWQAIEKLYHAARELPPAERALLLAQACPADDSLRHEVEVLLQCDGAEWGFIDGRAIEFTAQRLAAAELNEVKPTLTGQQIGAYKILGPLGKGGMGEVYRAKDARLNREVAIKVLPSSFVKDENRLKRFEREARATSALNHPNILTVHDIGQHQGAPYIVAELLEGQELRGALKQGALPLRKVLDYARQITAGLTAAHAKGIVHRDLKPENLFVTNDGRIKILDFGLAKLKPLQFESSASLLSPAPKPLVNLTDSGMLMGTVAYMSPEQMRGEAVDQRSDIFSFGLILYEMLCGGRAFQRDTMAETMAAILKDDPPELSESNPRISPQLEKLVQHCLEKEPERRFQAASDLGFALDALATQSSSGANQADNVPRLASRATGWRARLWPIAAAGFALLALAFALAYLWRPMLEAEPMRFSVNPPEKATFFDWPTISPDGRTLVFVAEVNGKTQLWVRTLGSMTARPLVEVNDSLPLPFWSPNNQFIAYFDGLKLKKIGLAGGAPEILCAVQQQGGGAWNRDGVILFGGMATGIKRISANGGDIAPVTSIDTARGDAVHLAPVFLPDGRHFLYFINNSDPAKNGIYLSSLAGGESKRLLSVDARTVAVAVNPADPRTGYVTFVRQGALLAQPFDFNQNQLVGEPTRIAEQIAAPVGRWARYSMATYGTVILREKEADEQLTWFDRTGKKLGVVGPPGRYTYPRISPDGKNLAVTMIKPPALQGDIYLFDLVGGAGIPFTFDPLQDEFPLWSPDGSRISWDSTREGTTNFFQKAARGTGQDEILLRSAYHKYLTDWSSDGRFILYRELNPQTSWDLWVMPLTGTQQPWPWLNTPASEVRATFSPDGQWIAYNSNESGRNEIYLQAFVPGAPASGGKRQLSTNGGGIPFWRHDGRELYYLAKDKLMAVEITPGADLKYRMAQELFAPSGFQWNADRGYASAGDGQRFLFVTSAEDNSLPPFTVVLNWMAEMKK